MGHKRNWKQSIRTTLHVVLERMEMISWIEWKTDKEVLKIVGESPLWMLLKWDDWTCTYTLRKII